MTAQLSFLFHVRYGLRSLQRGGQRTILALVCVAFGVMSLTAMLTLSNLLTGMINTDPRVELGGDLMVSNHENPLSVSQLDQLAQLQRSGQLQRYTLVTRTTAKMLLTPNGTGHAFFINDNVFGIDPSVYPLVGSFTLRNTAQTLAQALSAPNAAILTRDVADQLHLKVGDSFTLSSLSTVAVQFQLTAIADRTPGNLGSTVYVTSAGAQVMGFIPWSGLVQCQGS